MGRAEISASTYTPLQHKNFCTPHYRNFCVKVDETSFKLYFAFIFYSIPLFANEIVTWKFCVVLHRLMQDGDAKVIAGSIKHGSLIGNFTF